MSAKKMNCFNLLPDVESHLVLHVSLSSSPSQFPKEPYTFKTTCTIITELFKPCIYSPEFNSIY